MVTLQAKYANTKEREISTKLMILQFEYLALQGRYDEAKEVVQLDTSDNVEARDMGYRMLIGLAVMSKDFENADMYLRKIWKEKEYDWDIPSDPIEYGVQLGFLALGYDSNDFPYMWQLNRICKENIFEHYGAKFSE